jgi:hypothetical protein
VEEGKPVRVVRGEVRLGKEGVVAKRDKKRGQALVQIGGEEVWISLDDVCEVV